MNKHKKIFLAGHNGLAGAAILESLKHAGYTNILTADRKDLDLTSQKQVEAFFLNHKPEITILSAAKVGGINANISYPAQFLYENLAIQNNIIHFSYKYGVNYFIFLSSSCIYPRECIQPMKEEHLFTGLLEPTNEGYALAKISGMKMLEYYKKQYGFVSTSLIPCNLYGPKEKFDLQHSHVLSALVKRFSDAKKEDKEYVELWGDGSAKREFMHVTDMSKGVLFCLENNVSHAYFNLGPGVDISIKELASLIKVKLNYKGEIQWDTSKPNGMPRKCMDVSKMKGIGFNPKVKLETGIEEMISSYNSQYL
ncbi:MAG: GDP-L-fucose synthase family protein [Cyclobacteriaceae bacterium]